MSKKQYDVDTKLDAKGDAKRTILTLDFTDCPAATLEGLAAQALVVKLQGGWRRNGSIPANLTVAVKDHAPGSRVPFVATPESIAAKAASMTKEQKLALIKQVQDSLKAV